MSATPFKTSNDLISAVKRRIAFPFSQNTFSEDDVLTFANEEMDIGQVPSVLEFHEDYFVFRHDVPLKSNRVRYPIPERAIGQRIKDLHYVDANGNEVKLFQILAENRSSFEDGNSGSNLGKYYFEGNDIVLCVQSSSVSTGSLRFTYYLRPNRLVLNERAAICQAFSKTIVVSNTTLTAGDTLSIGEEVFIAGTDFTIGVTPTDTASSLKNAINVNGVGSAVSTAATIVFTYEELDTSIITTNSVAFSIQVNQGIVFDNIPENISALSKVDFLQTWGGHKSYRIDVSVKLNAIDAASNTIEFPRADINDDFRVGDYICTHHECIIPQIPDDLHISLIERTCASILASLSDTDGLRIKQEKIKEIEYKQGSLIDNRSEGSPKKINNLNSHLRNSKRRNSTRR